MRVRVLVSLVALSAFDIALTGVVAYGFISADVDSTIDAGLRSRTEAFYALADGLDPATGLGWTEPADLVRAGVQNVAASDTTSAVGFVGGEAGFDREKLAWVKEIKNERRGRISDYLEKFPDAVFTPVDADADSNPLWNHEADCAFPSATQNEINGTDARNLVKNGVQLVAEGANMPSTLEAAHVFLDAGILYGPAKASNAGGVAVSGLEMAQNSARLSWTSGEVDTRLRSIMATIHHRCSAAAEDFGTPGNYVNGANIAGFLKVANAMRAQGVV